jgi:hypothetical protein
MYASIVVQHLDDDLYEGARVEGGDDGVLHHVGHDRLLLPLFRACRHQDQRQHNPNPSVRPRLSAGADCQPGGGGGGRERKVPPVPLEGLQWTLMVARSRISSLCFTSIGP